MLYCPQILKICPTCKHSLPATLQFFYRDRTKKSGFSSRCRNCVVAASKKWLSNNKERAKVRSAAYYADHREEIKIHVKQYAKVNRAAVLESSKVRYWSHREERKKTAKEYRATHPGQNTEYYKSWRETHRQEFRTRMKNAQQRRRAQKLMLPDDFTSADWSAALDYFHGTCAYCGNPPSLFDINTVLHQEHFIPVVAGGGFSVDNIVPACQTCNHSKNARPAAAWLTERFGTRKAKQILDRIEAYFEWVKRQE